MKIRTDAKRRAIIEAASVLFKEFGYECASMNELAARVGGSKATLYGYFRSKEELFTAVVRTYATSHLAEATNELKRCAQNSETLEITLLRFAERVLLVLANDTNAMAVYRMVVAEAGRSDVGDLFQQSGPRECMEALTETMRKGMDRQQLRKGEPFIFAKQFMALAMAETSHRTLQRSALPLTSAAIKLLARRAVDMFFHGAGCS